MGAPQNKRIDLFVPQRSQVLLDDHLGFPTVQPSLFYQGNQQRAGLAVDGACRSGMVEVLVVQPGVDGGPGADHPNIATGTDACRLGNCRLNDINNGVAVVVA